MTDRQPIDIGTRTVRQEHKVTIPKETRDRYGLEVGDYVDIKVEPTDGTSELICKGCRIVGHGQVIIPAPQRRFHGIEVGDYVDMEIVPTDGPFGAAAQNDGG